MTRSKPVYQFADFLTECRFKDFIHIVSKISSVKNNQCRTLKMNYSLVLNSQILGEYIVHMRDIHMYSVQYGTGNGDGGSKIFFTKLKNKDI